MSVEKWPRARMPEFDGYEPQGPFRTVVAVSLTKDGLPEDAVFESLPDAINHWVLYATPPVRNATAVVQDSVGTVLLGYSRSKDHIIGYAWWGIREAYELLAEHQLMNPGEVALWEIQASGVVNDIVMSS